MPLDSDRLELNILSDERAVCQSIRLVVANVWEVLGGLV